MLKDVRKKTLALVSLGCAKNAADLQVMAGNLVKAGATLSPDPDRADIAIVNTCSFIASAREEAEAEILRALELKRRGQYGRVVVTGCYPQRYPDALAKFPGVDEWRGVPREWVEPKIPALRLTGKAFAYLKIAEGCAHRCAYCAIPSIRGKYRSRPMKSILREARALIASGCRELNIVAQDPMLWREKKAKAGGEGGGEAWRTLPDLLRAIDRIPGDLWVRVLYSDPSEITEDFVVWMMTSKHAVRYVDIPLQHTVPEVLAKMNRKQAIDASLVAAEALRDLMPDITLRTTILVGFPGETELRFRQLLSDLRRMQFDHLGAFAYSPEEGTKGAKMRGRPPRAVAERREKEVMDMAKALWGVKAKRMVGQTFRALVVAPGVARMESQAPDVDGVTFIEEGSAEVGSFVNVKLVRRRGFDFVARIVE